MGAWFFIREHLEEVLASINNKYQRITYIGRPEAASPASGSLRHHIKQQNALIDEALTIPIINKTANIKS